MSFLKQNSKYIPFMILFALLHYIFSLKNKTKLQIQNTFVMIFPSVIMT